MTHAELDAISDPYGDVWQGLFRLHRYAMERFSTSPDEPDGKGPRHTVQDDQMRVANSLSSLVAEVRALEAWRQNILKAAGALLDAVGDDEELFSMGMLVLRGAMDVSPADVLLLAKGSVK